MNRLGWLASSSYDLAVEDLESRLSLAQKRQLLDLKKWLDRRRTFRAKIEWLQGILVDQQRSDDHHLAQKLLLDYKRRLANAEEAIELNIQVLGLFDRKLDLEKQLAAILEDHL